jgi:PhnB protein
MEKVKSIPEGFSTLTPSLVVQGGKDAIEFYKQAFGANVKRIFYGPDKKTIFHAELEIGHSILILSEELPMMNLFSPKSIGGGTSVSLYMYVDKVDDVFANAVSAGALVATPLMDTFYGDRCCAIIDPFGHHWILATHTKNLTDEEIKRFLM